MQIVRIHMLCANVMLYFSQLYVVLSRPSFRGVFSGKVLKKVCYLVFSVVWKCIETESF